jgi:hypothetical protein
VAAQRIVREIMSACLALEQPLNIAYLGPEGTYSESAARKHFGGAPSLQACSGIDDVFRAVESGNAALWRGADREFDRRRDRSFARPAAVLAPADLRRDQPAIHHQLMARRKAGWARSRASTRMPNRWPSATNG